MPTGAQLASAVSATVELTPHLTLAVALQYVAVSDGELRDAPKRQLLAALGGDDAALRVAAKYVQSIPFDQFLQAASHLLSTQEKLCILVNACEVLMTYSPSVAAKLALFDRMLTAFGLSTDAFAPYYKTIVLKNDNAILGAYDSQAATSEQLTAHVALATSMLYTVAASGAIADENMAQLQTLIGEFDGLQGIALAYIRRVKFNQFLPQASARLTGPQKLYILVHACDSLLLVDHIEDLERQIFQAMLTAFGYNERSFRPYFHTMEIKHAKPVVDLPDASATSAKGTQKHKTFETRIVHVGDKTKSLVGASSQAANPSALLDTLTARDTGAVFNRAMKDNVQETGNGSGPDANVAFINPNASQGANIQNVGQAQAALNRQTLDSQGLVVNRQSVGVDRFDDQRALIPEEERLKDLDVIIDNLQRKIDQFERKNKTVLREATQAKIAHPPDVSDDLTQISTPHHPRAVATSHLQVEKAAERILDLHNEARDWTVIWISSIVAIVCFTGVMSVRIVLG